MSQSNARHTPRDRASGPRIAHDIGDGFTRFRLESPSHLVANAYLLRSGDALALFDTGFTHTTDALQEGLRELGLTLADLTHVVYTHTHPDHLGGGIALADQLKVEHVAWAGTPDAFFSDFYRIMQEREETPDFLARFLPASPERNAWLDEMRAIPEGPLHCGGGVIASWTGIAFGEELTLGGRTIVCVDARGHDPYHAAWLDTQTGTLLSGDVVMRVPTPLLPTMGDQPGRWLLTLEEWEARDDLQRLLPGHGMPTALVRDAICRSRNHLKRMYEATAEELEEGIPCDPLDVVQRYLGEDRSRYAQRYAVALGTLASLLSAMQDVGLVRELESHHWVARGGIATFERFCEQLTAPWR